MSKRQTDLALIGVFLSTLTGLAALAWLLPDSLISEGENRSLACLPTFSSQHADLFPADFEAYFNDRMPFRSELARLHSAILYFGLATSASRFVEIGGQHRLYFCGDQSESDIRHTIPFTAAELDQWTRFLNGRTAALAARHCHYLFACAPNNSSVYPEFLPPALAPVAPHSRLDQLGARLKDEPLIPFISLASSQLEHKQAGDLFFHTDTHWNYQGAYFAYRQIVAALSKDYPDLRPVEMPGFQLRDQPLHGDLARMLGLTGWLCEPCSLPLVPTIDRQAPLPGEHDDPDGTIYRFVNPNKANLPTAVVFNDSMGDFLRPYLATNFSKVTFRHTVSLELDQQLLAREQPNIVIQEVSERNVSALVPWSNQDWRQWVFSAMQAEGARSAWLNIVPDTPEINIQRYLADRQPPGCSFRPTSPRRWTLGGQEARFNETIALFSDWYLLKTGPQGVPLRDYQSLSAYEKLIAFVSTSRHFRKIAELPLADGNRILLYRRIDP